MELQAALKEGFIAQMKSIKMLPMIEVGLLWNTILVIFF